MKELLPVETIKPLWMALTAKLSETFGEAPDLQSIIFLIGVQEFGKGRKDFSKDEKQDLMHIATCKLLSQHGYYELEKTDDDGWPHYRRISQLPKMPLKDQDLLLKQCIIEYFKSKGIFEFQI